MKISFREDYRTLRARSYPALGDQLDAMWKILAALQAGAPIPPEAADLQARIQDIKRGAPKP